MRTFAHIALLGLASALRLTQDPAPTPDDPPTPETPDIVISDILEVTFHMFDTDGNGTVSKDEFTTGISGFIDELEAHGYSSWYYEGLQGIANDADWFYSYMEEEYNYDTWSYEGDGELTFEEFEEEFLYMAEWYGLSEIDLGVLLVGLADENGDWYITEAELQAHLSAWGSPLSPEEVTAWFNEMHDGYSISWQTGEPAVDIWDFEYWYRDEEFKISQAQPSVGDLIRVVLDSLADDDGNLEFWPVVEKIKDILDKLADDKKLTRSRFPDNMVEAWVAAHLRYIDHVGYPTVPVDQGVYALTQGEYRPTSYDLLYRMEWQIFQSDTEGYDSETWEWRPYTEQGISDQLDKYGFVADQETVSDIFNGWDADGDGLIEDYQLWEWASDKYRPNPMEELFWTIYYHYLWY